MTLLFRLFDRSRRTYSVLLETVITECEVEEKIVMDAVSLAQVDRESLFDDPRFALQIEDTDHRSSRVVLGSGHVRRETAERLLTGIQASLEHRGKDSISMTLLRRETYN